MNVFGVWQNVAVQLKRIHLVFVLASNNIFNCLLCAAVVVCFTRPVLWGQTCVKTTVLESSMKP